MYLGLIFFIRYLFFESFTRVFDLQWFKGKDKINNVTRYLDFFKRNYMIGQMILSKQNYFQIILSGRLVS